MQEGVLALVRLLQRFSFELSPEHHSGPLVLHSAITLTPKDGIWVRVHRRNN